MRTGSQAEVIEAQANNLVCSQLIHTHKHAHSHARASNHKYFTHKHDILSPQLTLPGDLSSSCSVAEPPVHSGSLGGMGQSEWWNLIKDVYSKLAYSFTGIGNLEDDIVIYLCPHAQPSASPTPNALRSATSLHKKGKDALSKL